MTVGEGIKPGGCSCELPDDEGRRCPEADMGTKPGGGPSSGRPAAASAEAMNPGGIGDPGIKPLGTSSGMGETGKGGSDTE